MALSIGTQSSLRMARSSIRCLSVLKSQWLYSTNRRKWHSQMPVAIHTSNTQIGIQIKLSQDTRTVTRIPHMKVQFTQSNQLCTDAASVQIEDTEERALLEAVNTLPFDELYTYQHFTKSISASIIKHRETTGAISSIQDLLQVPGISEDRLEKLNYSINKKIFKTVKQSLITGLGSFIHPRLRLKEVPASVVSVHIHLPHVSWIRMTRDLMVDDWQTVSLVDENKKLRYDHAMYQQKVWELCSRMPAADLYLLEETPLRVNTTQIMPTLNRNYVEASLTTALTLRHCPPVAISSESKSHEQLIRSPDGALVDPEGKLSDGDNHQGTAFQHVVYKLKPKAVSEHFSLLVGGERTSSLRLLSEIMNGNSEAAKGVYVVPELWDELWDLPKVLQEQRAQALLVATTFYKLLLCDRNED